MKISIPIRICRLCSLHEKRTQVPRLVESRLTIRVDEDQGAVPSAEDLTRSAIWFHFLVSKKTMIQEKSIQDHWRAKLKTVCPLDDQRVTLSTLKAFNYFQTPCYKKSWHFWSSLVGTLDRRSNCFEDNDSGKVDTRPLKSQAQDHLSSGWSTCHTVDVEGI